MTAIIENNIEKLIALCQKYKVAELDVFGSAATDDFDADSSDIDLLVEFDDSVKQTRFDNFFNLHEELKELFGRNVDLVEPGGLKNPYFIESLNRTRRSIYVAS